MPYKVRKSGSGYKVTSPGRSYSKKPMSKAKANRQLAAIKMHSNEGLSLREFFMMEEVPPPESNEHLPDPDAEGEEFEKTAPITAVQMDEPFEVETIEGPTEGKAGDWLCKGHNGDMWVVDDEMFRDTYEPTEPNMAEVFQVYEAPIQNRPPPGSKPINPADWTQMGQMGRQLKNNLETMKNMGQQMNAYTTPAGDRLAFPADAAPGRGPMKADTTKGVWSPMTGSQSAGTGAPATPFSPTTTTTK